MAAIYAIADFDFSGRAAVSFFLCAALGRFVSGNRQQHFAWIVEQLQCDDVFAIREPESTNHDLVHAYILADHRIGV